jgi:sporulation protein YqfC
MTNIFKLKSKLASIMELPKEIVMNLPLISIVGNEEISIENYKGVIEYTGEKLRVSTTCGVIGIEGKRLRIKWITPENIAVTGRIVKMGYIP